MREIEPRDAVLIGRGRHLEHLGRLARPVDRGGHRKIEGLGDDRTDREIERPGGVVGRARSLGHEDGAPFLRVIAEQRSEEHTSELQSLMRLSYAVFCLKKKKNNQLYTITQQSLKYLH